MINVAKMYRLVNFVGMIYSSSLLSVQCEIHVLGSFHPFSEGTFCALLPPSDFYAHQQFTLQVQ